MNVAVYNLEGEKTGDIALPAHVFGQPLNEDLLAQAVHIYRYNQAKGTSHTKDRGEVRGGGKKPWRQKGTGRARHGSIREPQWRGGGIAFGPRYSPTRLKSLPQKMRRLALCVGLSSKAHDERLVVVEHLKLGEIKTKVASATIHKLPTAGSILYVATEHDANTLLSFRNISNFHYLRLDNINIYDILKCGTLLITKQGVNALDEQFKDISLKKHTSKVTRSKPSQAAVAKASDQPASAEEPDLTSVTPKRVVRPHKTALTDSAAVTPRKRAVAPKATIKKVTRKRVAPKKEVESGT
jgi:large subunit ribosomal protein L4